MYLVDTNVVSELAKTRPSARVVEWLERQRGIALSVISMEELTFGIARVKGVRRAKLAEWLEELLRSDVEIFDVSYEIARASGEIRARRDAAGFQLDQADTLIAATVFAHGLTVATRNVRHFEDCGVAVFDPFAT